MNIDFDKIRNENIIEYGAGVRHLSFLGRLYADKTHFIFELLQNAEDAKARKIKFILYPDRLEILHDGRIFNESDVRGISGVGKSIKAEDLTQIGKFGIGFKSVYAYTLMPEVHCKGNHFKIENFVRPYKIEERDIVPGWTTLFIFPFASKEVDDIGLFQQTSFKQISSRLRKLSVRTLLFLRSLEEIEYVIDNDTSGVYLRENRLEKGYIRITVINQKNNEKDEQWIVFSSPISETTGNLNAEIAFKIEQDKNGNDVITKLKQSYLNVFFPTEKETRLGFLIQGPYRTTPARDNIPQEDECNKKLVEETAKLLQGSLNILKREGLLTVNLLETLPINDYPDDWMFWPLYKAVKLAFVNNAFLPTATKSFVKASNAKLARGKGLRELINAKQLTSLFDTDSKLKWLSEEITQDRTPGLRQYLIHELDIEEIDPENFAKKLSHDFLCDQSDKWHIEFYDFLTGQEALWRKGFAPPFDGPLRQKEIIRCKDGENRQPYDDKGRPQVFLPVSSYVEFSVVKPNIYSNEKAQSFLENLGLSKPDICAKVIKEILPFFESEKLPEKINLKQYQEKLNIIQEAVQAGDSRFFDELITTLKLLPWIWAENFETVEHKLKKPSEIHIPADDLCMYFKGNKDIWFVSSKVQINEKLLLLVGVSNKVKIQCKGLKQSKIFPLRKIELWSIHSWHGRGLRCFDPYTSVEGLEEALKSITMGKAIYIWNTFVVPLANFIEGEFETATRKDFSNADIPKKQYSAFGALIMENSWVPTINGEFKKPSECCVDDLHHHRLVIKEEQLIKQMGISPSPRSVKFEAITELRNFFNNQGISTDIADLLIENKETLTPDFLKEALSLCQERRAIQKPSFPSKKSANPGRREGKVRKKHSQAENKTYEKKERSVKTSRSNHDPKTWLKDQYTNDDEIMVCQMCTNEMPFKLKDGYYYFEAVQISDDFPKEGHELYFALCPLCAAKYRYLVKNDQVVLDNFINSIKENNVSVVVPIDLEANGSHSISFVETHLNDLKTILNLQHT